MPALLRACELIEELGAGEVIDGIVDVCAADLSPKTLPFEPDKMNALLGTALSADEQKEMLERLEFKIADGKVEIPSFRIDIARMCDLAEEVARMYGYDNIPVRLYAGDTTQGGLSPKQLMERAAADVCLAAGFDESMSHSFISPKFYDAINLPADDVRRISTTILNPLGEDFSIMRTTVLPSMLDSLSHNNAHRNATASLYELGTIYTPVMENGTVNADQLPHEEKILTLGDSLSHNNAHRNATASLYELGTIYTPVMENGTVNADQLPHEEKILTLGSYGRLSFFQFKGVIEALCRELNVEQVMENGTVNADQLPHEEKILTLGSYGRLSFFQFKGVIEALCRELNVEHVDFVADTENPSYHPGRCAKVYANETLLGVFGTVHPMVAKKYGFSAEVLAAELNMDALFACMNPVKLYQPLPKNGTLLGVFGTVHPMVAKKYGFSAEVLAAELNMDALVACMNPVKLYQPLPKFPASTRDIAVLVDDAVPAASMQKAIERAAGSILENVKLFDVYKGKGIPEGKKSVAYSMSLRAADRTLTDDECDKAMKNAIEALEQQFGAALRA